jgi:ASC-1-like (ASCH) protein
MFESMTIAEPWFTLGKQGKKTIEGRLKKDKFTKIKKNDNWIVFNNDKSDRFQIMVLDVCEYSSFQEYLSKEGLKRTLPNVSTIEDGVNIYRQFYSELQEREFGIIAIHFRIC